MVASYEGIQKKLLWKQQLLEGIYPSANVVADSVHDSAMNV
jgi:hypothetical protein